MMGKLSTIMIVFSIIYLNAGCANSGRGFDSPKKDNKSEALIRSWKFDPPQSGWYVHYKELHPLHITIHETRNSFVFEFQTNGNIESTHKKYGNGMQFQIYISGLLSGTPRYYRFYIVTTGDMKEAVLLEACDTITTILDNNDKAVSTIWNTPEDAIARLNVEVDGDRMKIFLPKKYLPDKNRWWQRPKRDDKQRPFRCIWASRLAPPPSNPIPSNIPGLYRSGIVYMTRCIDYKAPHRGQLFWPGEIHNTKRLDKDSRKQNKK